MPGETAKTRIRLAMTDERFLSVEDQDLANLTDDEFYRWWHLWLQAAQVSNDDDAHLYSHGVFTVEPGYEHLAAGRIYT